MITINSESNLDARFFLKSIIKELDVLNFRTGRVPYFIDN